MTIVGARAKNPTIKLRGISIFSDKSSHAFDLYLHGALNNQEKNVLEIGKKLETNKFYTLQVWWNGQRGIDSFYSLYKDGRALERCVLFRPAPLSFMSRNAFYVGGMNNTRVESSVVPARLQELSALWKF